MYFSNEKEQQEFIAMTLQSTGDSAKTEARTPTGKRLDILTSNFAIEVKPTLTRSALFQAAGQMGVYAPHFPDRTYVLAGLMPKEKEAAMSAQSTAKDIESHYGYTVWFTDQIPVFQDAYRNYISHGEVTPQPSPQTHYDREPVKESWEWWQMLIIAVLIMFFGPAFCSDASTTPALTRHNEEKTISEIVPANTSQSDQKLAQIRLIGAGNRIPATHKFTGANATLPVGSMVGYVKSYDDGFSDVSKDGVIYVIKTSHLDNHNQR